MSSHFPPSAMQGTSSFDLSIFGQLSYQQIQQIQEAASLALQQGPHQASSSTNLPQAISRNPSSYNNPSHLSYNNPGHLAHPFHDSKPAAQVTESSKFAYSMVNNTSERERERLPRDLKLSSSTSRFVQKSSLLQHAMDLIDIGFPEYISKEEKSYVQLPFNLYNPKKSLTVSNKKKKMQESHVKDIEECLQLCFAEQQDVLARIHQQFHRLIPALSAFKKALKVKMDQVVRDEFL